MTEITLTELERLGVCSDACILFAKIFGEKTSVKNLVKELHKKDPPLAHSTNEPANYKEWEAWLLLRNSLLTKVMIENGANVNANGSNAFSHNAFLLTFDQGNLEIMRLLLEKGVDKTIIRKECDFVRRILGRPGGLTELLEQYV